MQCQGMSWETDVQMHRQILHVHALHGCGSEKVHTGDVGDITKLKWEHLPAASMLISGPPCPPWSRSGAQQGWQDSRAEAFMSCVLMIEDQAKRPKSKFDGFVLENVHGMRDKKKGSSQSPCAEIVAWLKEKLGDEWHIWTWDVKSWTLGLPHHRLRVYICGRRCSAFSSPLPRTIPSQVVVRQRHLRDILDSNLPDELDKLTTKMRSNLCMYISKFEATTHDDPLLVACMDLTRAAGKVRPLLMRSDGLTICLTTVNNPWFYGLNPTLPRYNRFITPSERAQIQGFAADTVQRVGPANSRRAFGNAMSVPSVGIVTACMWSGHL